MLAYGGRPREKIQRIVMLIDRKGWHNVQATEVLRKSAETIPVRKVARRKKPVARRVVRRARR